jgi:DNA-binding HxlR family transcriptional regulator|tara:strand:- start:328 stop:564 length:237 start_codon:yes stop_codon:yes gene_type:complete
MTPYQKQVIRHIISKGYYEPKDSTTSQQLDELFNKGIVSRQDHWHRTSTFRLTEKGERISKFLFDFDLFPQLTHRRTG